MLLKWNYQWVVFSLFFFACFSSFFFFSTKLWLCFCFFSYSIRMFIYWILPNDQNDNPLSTAASSRQKHAKLEWKAWTKSWDDDEFRLNIHLLTDILVFLTSEKLAFFSFLFPLFLLLFSHQLSLYFSSVIPTKKKKPTVCYYCCQLMLMLTQLALILKAFLTVTEVLFFSFI